MEINTDEISNKIDELNKIFNTKKNILFSLIFLDNVSTINLKNGITLNEICTDTFFRTKSNIQKKDEKKDEKKEYIEDIYQITDFHKEFNKLIYTFFFNLNKDDFQEDKYKKDINTTVIYKVISDINKLIKEINKEINKETNKDLINKYLELCEKYYKIVFKFYKNKIIRLTSFMTYFTSQTNRNNTTKFYLNDFYIIEYLILKHYLFYHLKNDLIGNKKYNDIITFFDTKQESSIEKGFSDHINDMEKKIIELKKIYYDILTEKSEIEDNKKIKFIDDFLEGDQYYKDNVISDYNNKHFLKKIRELCIKVNELNEYNLIKQKQDCENIIPYDFLVSFKNDCETLHIKKHYDILNDLIGFIQAKINKYSDILQNLSSDTKENIKNWLNRLKKVSK